MTYVNLVSLPPMALDLFLELGLIGTCLIGAAGALATAVYREVHHRRDLANAKRPWTVAIDIDRWMRRHGVSQEHLHD